MNLRTPLVSALIMLDAIVVSHAQNKPITLSGKVSNKATAEAVEFASVVVKPHGSHTLTLHDGSFSISNLPSGKLDIEVQFFGMNRYDTTIVAKSGEKYYLNVKLSEANFRIDDVVVVAKKNESGSSTASEINRQAMVHLQTSSLKDSMTLRPGVSLSNPTLGAAQSISIRNNSGSVMNTLGTSVIVDGAPLSNNANLQFLASAQSGETQDGSGLRDASSGVDIRTLSTDNIESVEVIRGVPSVQYGDLTSGAVIVKSRAGKSPLTVRFKTNPNIYQASLSKGLSLGRKMGDLNVSGDYAYSRNSLQAAYQYYQRGSAKLLWSVRPSEIVSTNNSLSLSFGNDRSKLNPDFEAEKMQYNNIDMGLILNSSGTASINGPFLKNINWSVNLNYTDKNSHYENTATNALNLYSTAMLSGQIYSHQAGLKVYDAITNEEITNASESGIKGTILPYSYFYTYDILGKELGTFAKLNAEFGHSWGDISDRLLVGADFKSDGNLGEGAIYDDEFPPFRNVGNASSGYRRRPFYEIPFVNQIGAYAENSFRYSFAGRNLNITAGARYLWVNGLSAVDPRINASVDIMPWLTLRGAWGYASKAPTSLYLNPNYAYQDEILYNGMSATTPEEQRLLLARTTVYDAQNHHLEIARNRKAELGLDISIAQRYKLYITAYSEKMNNGYSMALLPESFRYYRHDLYATVDNVANKITKTGDVGAFFEVYMPANAVVNENNGIEYELDLGRFDAIRTSVSLNGAWTKGTSYSAIKTYNTRISGNRMEHNIGVYEPGRVKYHESKHITTLRLTHNIPQIGFVVTLTTQANWFIKSWNEYRQTFKYDENEYDIFTSYLSYKDGKEKPIDFNESLINDPEFSYLLTGLNSENAARRCMSTRTIPFLLFNLNLSKEIGDMLTASFYVNNFFNSRPLWRDPKDGVTHELGIPIFFGFEFKVNIR